MATPQNLHNLDVIENGVPFGDTIYEHIIITGHPFTHLIRHGTFEQHYLAWETVRKEHNPYFTEGTGFEGYFVGRCHDPEAALEHILSVNQDILDMIARFYRFEYGFQSKLIKTLTREHNDSEMIRVWSTYLGAALARLRCQVVNNYEARRFRAGTYQIVEHLPDMRFQMADHSVQQRYVLKRDGKGLSKRLTITLNALKPSQQDAWMVAENIGEFGHPLIRQYLREMHC